MKTSHRSKILLKAISLVVSFVFITQDFSWAVTSLRVAPIIEETLQVPLMLTGDYKEDIAKACVSLYIRSLGTEAFMSKRHLYPVVRGHRVHIYPLPERSREHFVYCRVKLEGDFLDLQIDTRDMSVGVVGKFGKDDFDVGLESFDMPRDPEKIITEMESNFDGFKNPDKLGKLLDLVSDHPDIVSERLIDLVEKMLFAEGFPREKVTRILVTIALGENIHFRDKAVSSLEKVFNLYESDPEVYVFSALALLELMELKKIEVNTFRWEAIGSVFDIKGLDIAYYGAIAGEMRKIAMGRQEFILFVLSFFDDILQRGNLDVGVSSVISEEIDYIVHIMITFYGIPLQGNLPKGLTTQNWPEIVNTTGGNGSTISGEDLKKIVLSPGSEGKAIEAMRYKQSVYAAAKGKETTDFNRQKLKFYTGTYMLPWDDFCRFMDENYEEFHSHPERFIQDPADMDLGEYETAYIPEDTDMGWKDDAATKFLKEIAESISGDNFIGRDDIIHLKRMSLRQDLDSATRADAIRLFGELTVHRPGLIGASVVDVLEDILETDFYSEEVYVACISSIQEIAKKKQRLIRNSTVDALLTAAERFGAIDTADETYSPAIAHINIVDNILCEIGFAFKEISSRRPALIKKDVLTRLMTVVFNNNHMVEAPSMVEAFIQMAHIVPKMPRKVLSALGGFLMRNEAHDEDMAVACAVGIAKIAEKTPDLRELAFEKLMKAMNKDLAGGILSGIGDVREACAVGLGAMSMLDPEIFAKVCDMCGKFMSDEYYIHLVDRVIEGMGDKVPISLAKASLKEEDWPVVLGTVSSEDDPMIRKEDLKKIICSTEREERTFKAIEIKQRIYCEISGKNTVPIDKSKLSHYKGWYMQPWEVFRGFMDENYETFHENPEDSQIDPLEMDLGEDEAEPMPEDADIGETIKSLSANAILRGYIDEGMAIEVNEIEETVKLIKFDRSNPPLSDLEDEYRREKLFEKIDRAKEKSRLAGLVRANTNFRNLDATEAEELIEIAQGVRLSLILGRGILADSDSVGSKIAHARTGYSSLAHGLSPSVWVGELLFRSLTEDELAMLLLEESQHILKKPAFVDGKQINIHGAIKDAPDPKRVIEHNEAFTGEMKSRSKAIEKALGKSAYRSIPQIEISDSSLDKAISSGKWGSLITMAEKMVQDRKIDSEKITDLIRTSCAMAQGEVARSIAASAMRYRVRGLSLKKAALWAEIIAGINPGAAEGVMAAQKELLRSQLEKDSKFSRNVFNYMHSRFPGILSGLGTEGFREQCLNILDGNPVDPKMLPKHEACLRNYFRNMSGERTTVTDEEAELIRTLSMGITRAVIDARKTRRLKNVGELSFREGMRFQKIFSRYYLTDMVSAKSRIFEYFVLSAWAVYGRFISGEDRKIFADILIGMFNKKAYTNLFTEASIESGMEITAQGAIELFDTGRFDLKEMGQDLLPYEKRILSAVERARAANMPAFIFTPAEYFPDAVVETLSSEPDSEVFPVTMSGFTQRKEFFGMHMPDDRGKVRWFSGAIARVAARAIEEPGKQIYLVLENPDLAAGDIRMAMHQLLLERKVTIEGSVDEKGKKKGEIELPSNMQLVLTMESQSEIGDESFMDRASGCHLENVIPSELKEYIEKRIGLSETASSLLIDKFYVELERSRETSEKVTLQDMIMIAHNSAGRIKDEPGTPHERILREEAALHLISKFSVEEESEALKILNSVVGDIPEIDIRIMPDGKTISFGGAMITIDPSSEFGRFVERKTKNAAEPPLFKEVLEEFLPKGYFVTDAEKRAFALLARVYRYSPSKVVFLQGLPGGGKTTIARVFLDITGCRRQEYTLNKETDLSVFRGGLKLTPGGLEVVVPEYWKAVPEDKVGVIINEADTRLRLMEWLWPVFIGRGYRLGWEYASTDKSNPMGKVGFGDNRMTILTGNIREDMPPIIGSAIPSTYRMDRTADEMVHITEMMVLSRYRKMPDPVRKALKKGHIKEKASLLATIYNDMTRAVRDELFESRRQITPRQIERLNELFFRALENGRDIHSTFNFLLNVIFASMWENSDDIATARNIILTHVNDLPPPPSPGELIDFISDFPIEDIPLLILTNGTSSYEEIIEQVMARHTHAESLVIPLSRFHGKKSLIGGLSRTPDDSDPVVKMGFLPELILKSHLEDRSVFCWLQGYLNMNPQVAPFLNEFFQTNRLEVDEILDETIAGKVIEEVERSGVYERLKAEFTAITGMELPSDISVLSTEEAREFTRYLIGYKGKNLKFRALGTAGEEISLHAADVDRFLSVNLSRDIDENWGKTRVLAKLSALEENKIRLASECIREALKFYDEQREDGLYKHTRLGPEEIDLYIAEIVRRYSVNRSIDEDEIKLLAYHILGMGFTLQEEDVKEDLRQRDYRKAYSQAINFRPDEVKYARIFEEKDGIVHYTIRAEYNGKIIDIASRATRHKNLDEARKIRLQAPLRGLLAQQASSMLFHSKGMPVVLEGDPGGGKTSGARDLAKATGRPYHEEGMFKAITLGTILGSLGMRGKEIVLNVLDKDTDGRYVLAFLRMYEEGGSFVADEGMVSKSAGHLIRWMVMASRLDHLDLGTYHPGLGGITVKRHPDFDLSITQNYHFKTDGRKPLPWEIDRQSGKVRVDNVLSEKDAIALIDYYLGGETLERDLKENFARVHILLSREHPESRMISPRDLIDTVVMLSSSELSGSLPGEKELYEAISINYLEGVSDKAERKRLEAVVRSVFPDFATPGYEGVELIDRGYSDIKAEDVSHLASLPGYMLKTRALERMVTSGQGASTLGMPPARQVLIEEKRGADGAGFVELFCHLTGRTLITVEGHPFITAKTLLGGESLEFVKDFDEYGHRRAHDSITMAEGVLRRQLVKRDDIETFCEKDRVPTVIMITNVESIPKNELVRLNELIATRSIILRDNSGRFSEYVLPEWVTIMPVTSDITRLTSPFANRFRKIGVEPEKDPVQKHIAISREFPNVTETETRFIVDAAKVASDFCGNGESQIFELGYDFTMREVWEMAFRIQMYKQTDSRLGVERTDPLWYALKSVNYVLLAAMAPQDRALFVRKGLGPAIHEMVKKYGPDKNAVFNYIKNTIREIRLEGRTVEYRYYEHTVKPDDLEKGVITLANGIRISLNEDNLTVITGANAYSLSFAGLKKNPAGSDLSPGMKIFLREDELVIGLRLFKAIGGVRLAADDENLKRSLPEEEMSVDDFMYPAGALVDTLKALLEAQTPVRTATGRIVNPRIALLAGETGSGKTTIPKMLSRAEGTPLVRINPWRNMHASKLTVSLSLGDPVEMTVADFLLACGKINGKRISAAYETSNRVRILVDEANVTRDAWYVIEAIARGEKRFIVETPAGDSVEVELDKEVEIALTYNPPERYGGTGRGSNRFVIPSSLAQKSVKIYTSEPIEEYSQDEMRAIMKEVYRRGEAHAKRMKAITDLEERSPSKSVPEGGFFEVSDGIFEIQKIPEQDMRSIEEIASEIKMLSKSAEEEKESGISAKEKDLIARKDAERFKFNENELIKGLSDFNIKKKSLSSRDLYKYFMSDVFRLAMKGIGHGEISDNLYHEVSQIAGDVDTALPVIMADFREACSGEELSSKALHRVMVKLHSASLARDIYLEGFEIAISKGRPVLEFPVVSTIEYRIKFDKSQLEQIVSKEDFAKVFKDHIPEIYVTDRPNDGILGYFDGRDMIVKHMGDREKEFEVVCHEFGHFVSEAVASKCGNRDIAYGLGNNVELYSMLFPVMLVEDPLRYIKETLLERIKNRVKDDDAYALASAAVLNAFCTEYELERVTKEYEETNIKRVMRQISKLNSEEIRNLAIKFWHNPATFFSEVEKGYYYKRDIVIKGAEGLPDMVMTLSKGSVFRPRVKTEQEIEVDLGSAGKTGKGSEDESEFRKIKDDLDKEPVSAIPKKKGLPSTLSAWLRKYQELFAPDDNSDDIEVRFVSEGGTDINPEAWITRNADELLIAPDYEEEEKTLAQNVFFIIDASGSIQNSPDTQEAIEEMIRHYSSFLLELSRKNPDLNVGLATITDELVILFDLLDWKKSRSHDQRRQMMEDAIERMWQTGTGGGIDTPVLMDTLGKVEFPANSAKDVKNLVVVLTDGEETGRAEGEELKEMINDFRKGSYRMPDGSIQVQSLKKQRIDMAFVGAMLRSGSRELENNYPSYLKVNEESTDAYIEALFKMAYMQAKKMPLEGDLSESISQLGKRMDKSEKAERAQRTQKYFSGRTLYSFNPLAFFAVPAGLYSLAETIVSYPFLSVLTTGGIFLILAYKFLRYNSLTGYLRIKIYEKKLTRGAGELGRIAINVPALGNRVILSLEKIFNSKGSAVKVYESAANALVEIAKNAPHLSHAVMSCLGNILNTKGLEEMAHFISAKAVIKITRDIPSLSDKAISISENVLYGVGHDPAAYWGSANILAAIVKNESELSDRAASGIEIVLNAGGLDPSAYDACTRVLGENSGVNPKFFEKVWIIVKNLISEGRIGLAHEIIDNFPDKLPASIISHTKDDNDWLVILSTISPEKNASISRDEFKELMLEPDIATFKAVKIKQRVYRRMPLEIPTIYRNRVEKKKAAVYLEKLPFYTGIYKLPWDEFCRFMDEHYEEFHSDPEKFIQDPSEMDLGDDEFEVLPEDTDMSETAEEEARRKIAKHEKVLNTLGLESSYYEYSAEALGEIAQNVPELGGDAIAVLERVLNTVDLESSAYEYSAKALGEIAQNVPDLGGDAIAVLERVLNTGDFQIPTLDGGYAIYQSSAIYRSSAYALGKIAKNRPELISRAIVLALEKVLNAEGLDGWSYSDSAEALGKIAQNVPELGGDAIAVLERILNTVDLIGWAYRYSAEALGEIAKNRPELISRSIVLALEKVLNTEGFQSSTLDSETAIYQSSAKALGEIAQNVPGVGDDVIAVLERVLNTEGLESSDYRYSAEALGEIAQNVPELGGDVIVVLEKVLNTEGLESSVYRYSAKALGEIAENRPELISRTIVLALEKVLNTEGLENLAYVASAKALGKIAGIDPECFKMVWHMIARLVSEGRTDLAYRIIDNFPQTMPLNIVSGVIREFDWPIILGTISPETKTTISREELKEFILAPEEAALKAVEIKQRAYCGISGKNEVKINEERLPSYVGTYKLPWDEFCRFMDEHYEEFHSDPEKFIQDPSEMDLGDDEFEVLPEDTDITGDFGKTAREKGDKSYFSRRKVYSFNPFVFLAGPPVLQTAISYFSAEMAVMCVIFTFGVALFAGWRFLGIRRVLGVIRNRRMIDVLLKTLDGGGIRVAIIEGLIKTDGLVEFDYNTAARVVSYIAEEDPGILRKSLVKAIVGKMKEYFSSGIDGDVLLGEKIESLKLFVEALTAVIVARQDLADEKILTLAENVFNSGYDAEDQRELYEPFSDLISSIAKKRPDLLSKEILRSIVGFVTNPSMSERKYMYNGGYHKAFMAITSIESARPDLKEGKWLSEIEEMLMSDIIFPGVWYAEVSGALESITTGINAELSERAMSIICRVLSFKEHDEKGFVLDVIKRLSAILSKRPVLISDDVVRGLIFQSSGAKEIRYSVSRTLRHIANIKPEYFQDALRVMDKVEGVEGQSFMESPYKTMAEAALKFFATPGIKYNEDWMVIMDSFWDVYYDSHESDEGQVDKLFRDRRIDEMKRILSETNENFRALSAMELKQTEYCADRGLGRKSIGDTKLQFYMGVYKLPWGEFCEFMDEHYEEFHRDPEKFIQDPSAMNLGDDEVDPAPEDADMTHSNLIGKITELAHDLTVWGLGYSKYVSCGEELEKIAENFPDLGDKVISAFEKVINERVIDLSAYWAIADSISGIAVKKPDLIRESTISSLRSFLDAPGLDVRAYSSFACGLVNIAANVPGLRDRAMSELEMIFNARGFHDDAYLESAGALGDTAKAFPELRDKAVSILGAAFNTKGLSQIVYEKYADTLGKMAQNIPDLRGDIILVLEKTLYVEGLDPSVYDACAFALGRIAGINPGTFEKVWNICEKAASEGRKGLEALVLLGLPGKMTIDITSGIKSEFDWPVILGTISTETNATISGNEIKKLKQDPENSVSLAIQIKQNVYSQISGKSSFPIDKVRLPFYVGIYKLPWDEFCRFMDEHYEEFHRNPEKFIQDPSGMDLGDGESLPMPEDTDMGVPPGRQEVNMIKNLGKKLRTNGLGWSAYESSTDRIREIVRYYPDLYKVAISILKDVIKIRGLDTYSYAYSASAISGMVEDGHISSDEAIFIFETILTVKDLDKDSYYSIANALVMMVNKMPPSFGEKVIQSLESMIKIEGLDPLSSSACAYAIGDVALNKPESISALTLSALEGLLNTSDLYPIVYESCASALVSIARTVPELRDTALSILKTILATKGLDIRAYSACAGAFKNMVTISPELVSDSIVSSLEEVLNTEEHQAFYSLVYESSADALAAIAASIPDLIKNSNVLSLESALTAPELHFSVYQLCADALSNIAKNRPGLVGESTVLGLEKILKKTGLDHKALRSSARAIGEISKKRPDLIRHSTLSALDEAIMNLERLEPIDPSVSFSYMKALSDIFMNCPVLGERALSIIQTTFNKKETDNAQTHKACAKTLKELAREGEVYAEKVISIFELVLDSKGHDPYVYHLCASTLGELADTSPEFFERIWMIGRKLISEGRIDISESIVDNFPEKLPVNILSETRGDGDWPLILSTITHRSEEPSLIAKDDLKEIILSPDTEDRTYKAILVKQRIYAAEKDISHGVITRSKLPHYKGWYLQPWEVFCAFMDEHYMEFHNDPEKFLQDPSEMDLGDDGMLIPEDSDMAELNKDAIRRKIAACKRILNTAELEFEDYASSAEKLGEIAKNVPELSGKAVLVLEKVLNTHGLDSYAYSSSAETLGEIAKNVPEERDKSISVLENALKANRLDPDAYLGVAGALGIIAVSKPELITSSNVSGLEKAIKTKGLDSLAYAKSAETIGRIAGARPELIKNSTVLSLEKILNVDRLDGHAYTAFADALVCIAQNVPDLREKVFLTIEKILITRGRGIDVYEACTKALGDMAINKPDLCDRVISTLEKMLNAEGLDPWSYWACALPIGMIAGINPEFFAMVWEIREKLISEGMSDLARYIVDNLPEGMPINITSLVKSEFDWPVILGTISPETNVVISRDQLKEIISEPEVATQRAIEIKQRVYCDISGKDGLPIDEKRLSDYTGIYMLPWEEFCEFMNENYEEFHKNPEELVIDPADIDLGGDEDYLIPEDANMDSYSWCQENTRMFMEILNSNPHLITSDTLDLIEEGIYAFVSETYKGAQELADLVSAIANLKPELFQDVLNILDRLIKKGVLDFGYGDVDLSEMIVSGLDIPSVDTLKSIRGRDWPLILANTGRTLAPECNPEIDEDDLKVVMLSESENERTFQAIQIKQRAYCLLPWPYPTRPIVEIRPEKLAFYTGIYMLPWEEFCEFMNENYEEFHKNPEEFVIDPADIDLGEGTASRLPEDADMSERTFDGSALKSIRTTEELALTLKQGVLSAVFNKKVVIGFTSDLGAGQEGNPIGSIREALRRLQRVPEYSKMLSNLIVLDRPVDAYPAGLDEFVGDKNAEIFLFMDTDSATKAKLGHVGGNVNKIHIEQDGFSPRAYYPLAEIVVLALCEYWDGRLETGEERDFFEVQDGVLELKGINIESVRREGKTLIFRLLPGAEKHDRGELLRRYGAILPFLEAA